MKDIQAEKDTRQVEIEQAGVTGLVHPIVVLDRQKKRQHTVATVQMSVGVPHEFKGTHMSRFIEVLNDHFSEFTMVTLPRMLKEMLVRLDAETARVDVRFPYFIEKAAPTTGVKALVNYECELVGEVRDGETLFQQVVRVPVTTLCPCSKAISDYGAHNQRGIVTIELQGLSPVEDESSIIWFEELIEVAEASGSAPVYALLKRADERYVTMQAYDNPVFVEDVVRNVATRLRVDPRIRAFRVSCENDESIHTHRAYAVVQERSR